MHRRTSLLCSKSCNDFSSHRADSPFCVLWGSTNLVSQGHMTLFLMTLYSYVLFFPALTSYTDTRGSVACSAVDLSHCLRPCSGAFDSQLEHLQLSALGLSLDSRGSEITSTREWILLNSATFNHWPELVDKYPSSLTPMGGTCSGCLSKILRQMDTIDWLG